MPSIALVMQPRGSGRPRVIHPTRGTATNSANSQGSSYSSYSDQANTELFEGTDTLELTATTLVDVDNVETTYKQRKLAALRLLKKHEAGFVKFPSGNMPLSTSKNPRVFGWLWPTLFPYGVGMVDNNIVRIFPEFGFRELDTLTADFKFTNLSYL
ncbi:hypothetical protein B0H13DRAFT_1852096 [Mycena leptocephala]|nr:hypothetical protein B0H13DRAFT_1852096 [Mycena leptocephala]